jgi:cytochrome b6-f complex iron-sulfur subunit
MSASTLSQQVTLNRREFLTLAWLASLGFILVDIGGVAYLFAMPVFREGQFGGSFSLGPASEVLPSPGGDPINYPKGKFWISRTSDNRIVAPYKVCPHLGCLYNWNSAEEQFHCPCHLSQYEIDGTYIRGPAPRSTDRFVIRLLNEQGVEVAATDPEGNPLALPSEELQLVVDTSQLIRGKSKGDRYRETL